MEIKYELTENSTGKTVISKIETDGSIVSFMPDPANSDYQQYLASLNEANEL